MNCKDMTFPEIELMLDTGKLEAHKANGGWIKVRRNGKTKRWKTMPDRFEIPIKYGFRGTGRITDGNLVFFQSAD